MLERPTFRPYFHLETVEEEGVFLLSEHGHFVLTGHLNELVVPLVDGERTADEIAVELADKAKPEEIFYTLALLERDGHLEESNGPMPEGHAAFWSSLGVAGSLAAARLAATDVAVQDLGLHSTKPVERALERLGLTTAAEGDVKLVVVDDYLHPGLRAINDAQLASRTPWMLLKPHGFVVWVGPLFVPGTTGCWECLARRLRDNREVEGFIEKKGQPGPFPVARSRNPASADYAIQLAALQTAIFVASGGKAHLVGNVVTANLAAFINDTHMLVRRPQCSACGVPHAWRNGNRGMVLHDIGRTYIQDGGHRSVAPEATFERFKHLVSPVTGVVSHLTPSKELNTGPLRVYLAGHNFALKSDSLYFLRDGLRTNSAGKGMTDAQARTSALCEAIERYSGVYAGEEETIRATYRDLGARAIHPNGCMLYSETQYRDRLQWLARQSRFQVVPLPFREDTEIEWTPVHSLTYGVSRYVPTGYVYYGYPFREEEFFYWADSNGNAAGNSIEEAILQGFLELIERDSVCIWWYNRLHRPAVDLSSLEEPYLKGLQDYYASCGRQLWVLDLTTDSGIPAFAALSRRVDHVREDIVMGFGAHLDPRVGILRAITEMNQFMPAVLGRHANGDTAYAFDDQEAIRFWTTATLANQTHLQPLGQSHTRRLHDYRNLCSDDVGQDVRTCVHIAAQLGIETLVLNQTRPDIGLAVVKVIAPGLRHFWARFAPGRLYDVPVRMGWLTHPTPEALLNPIAMFI